jgi:hypothetical protein
VGFEPPRPSRPARQIHHVPSPAALVSPTPQGNVATHVVDSWGRMPPPYGPG